MEYEPQLEQEHQQYTVLDLTIDQIETYLKSDLETPALLQ